MTPGLRLVLAILLSSFTAVASAAPVPDGWPKDGERRSRFDLGWRFQKGDAAGAEKADLDDGAWRVVDLPHDWAIEGPFDQSISPHQGSLPYFGVAWYRRHFSVPAGARGRFFSIEFDGAMSNATVYLNGHELGRRPYGYIGFAFDLTPHLKVGGENVLAVRLAPENQSSRWYPGAGLYRHVWIDATGPVHVARWGTFVTTQTASDAAATVSLRAELANREPADARVTVTTTIVDAAGREVARSRESATIAGGATATTTSQLNVTRPTLWDLDHPYLYTAISEVRRGDAVLDRYTTPFGIRTLAWGAGKGLLLNGRPVTFQGVCNHHDLGALGAAVNQRAIDRQVEIMKAMGVNAIRTSHNPPAPELLEAADRLGVLIMDEAFDMWGKPKVPNGHGKFFAEWGERDLRDMIRRDRNHPSVVLWSIGNEILEQSDEQGWQVAKRLTDICHEEDPSRPTTAGFNQIDNAIKNKLADQVDIPGFNYGVRQYAPILAAHPGWTIVGSETASCVSSRGVYHLPVEKYEKHPSLQISSYDVIAPPWAYCPDVEFAGLDASPAVLGEFVWTGFDYLGEPTPYFAWDQKRDQADWPSRSSYFGIVDLAGFPKDRFYLYQSRWTSAPMVHLLPHWNWAGREGQIIPVMAYTNAEEVELFLNGRSLGTRRKGEPFVMPVGKKISDDLTFTSKYRLVWQVPFEPGTLKAVARTGGKQVAATEVRTAAAAARVSIAADRTELRADGDDLSFLTVRVEDAAGTLVPEAANLVRFTVEGAGRLVAVDNGNPASLESFQASERKAFSGMALLVVRTTRGAPGAIRVRAESNGLAPAEIALQAR